MLCGLRISNFALIDLLELDFARGLNVLTGETGAGKSIILDAIDCVLGGKVSHRLIRDGSEKAVLEATFSTDSYLKSWLQEQSLDWLEDETIVVSREVGMTNGSLRSRSRINGILVNRGLLTEIRDRLVEITAQGQTVQLMIPARQRELLDLYGGEKVLQQRQIVNDCYEIWQQSRSSLEKRRQSEQQRLQRLDLLEYQIKELETAQLNEVQELEQLQQEGDRLAHVGQLQQLSYQIYQILYQNDHEQLAISDLLTQTEHLLNQMLNFDEGLQSILEIIQNASAQIMEASYQINDYADNLEADPGRLEEIQTRINLLKQICRKYGPSLQEAINYYQQLQGELAELTEQEETLEDLEKKCHLWQIKLIEIAEKLTILRQQTAKQLEKQLIEELRPLAMDKVIFQCRITPTDFTANGADLVEFYFSPNPGEKVQPLSQTASGGEMSRFLLALKACFSETKLGEATLIFDEIDAGVSGKVAQAIAFKLHELSNKNQVLCVTHQPLIAAMADNHLRVEKTLVNDSEIRTVVRVQTLDNHHTRREELAQLTGGNNAQEAIAFADSILVQAATKRKKSK
jgi:DNA repair protein RecN (Recombination protein N)